MASVLPITDSLSAPLPATALTQPIATTQAPAVADTVDTPATTTATTTSPLAGISNQPLSVVFNALASAGLDTAIDQDIVAPTAGQATGSFSLFMEELFTALAAQSASAEQSAQNAAAQQAPASAQPIASTSAPATTAATTTAATTSAATTSAQSTAANSALETDVQTLAQSVSAQTFDSLTAAGADSTGANSLSPLQQSFDQLVNGVGGTSNSASLGGFLQALANNLHTVQSPRGNLVDLQT